MALQESYSLLIKTLCGIEEVLSIGKSGGEKLPAKNESDIDIFIFCSQIPDVPARQAAIEKMGSVGSNIQISKNAGRFWGVCDFVTLEGTEICLMYFTVTDMDNEIQAVLIGSRKDRENEYFYPTGRCATFLSMHILYDENGYISAMKERLSSYPGALAETLFRHHVGKINDEEDFERAVSRKDVLFYHSVLENAIDHYLQALFALNHCFFPSRKRTGQFMEGFRNKPQNCAERLLNVIELGSKPETLSQSYEIWSELCNEITGIAALGMSHGDII